VTLRLGEDLRGSAGALEPAGPLVAAVASAAAEAARDPRFPPLRAAVAARLEVVVTLLGPGRPLRDPGDLVPGRDAVAVERGWQRGLLLPGAAGEGAEATLRRACLQAGLPPAAWAEPDARVRLYAAEVLRPGGA